MIPMMGNGLKLETAVKGYEEQKKQTVHRNQAETKTDKTVVMRARENNNSTSNHENCNRHRTAMTNENGLEGMITMVCQATKLKRA
jgi:L-serine deaminase